MSACISAAGYAQSYAVCDQICGKWMSADKNLAVQVYKDGDDFKAKIIWFNDSDDKAHPMEERVDVSNPDKALRNRKILGMNVLENLVYDTKSNSWEKGIIYDAVHGRYWDSSAYIAGDGALKVTGYWHFKFIGKTLTFTRM
ncbi:DUF2147 domain-containing protein [Mucilaginibacter sp. AW1-3]